ncbi:hypothetical protein [Anaeromicropila herbilytica]|uniref:Uncharacterized protein n=1 Tax=Anaeromicropila herbilytica TaxID=2785025 RepID=A0A7R7EP30_9FIRM|nr:hypothetical protein [Anaeromicropila herbilytica]BCN32368.1 hypothetical protein bsdtb5_36630 [Anaeromicropila herbilytica]
MSTFLVKSEELTNIIINNEYEHISDLIPSIYINFNKKILISNFPEPASYQEFIPDDWKGEYDSFSDLIPENQKYWLVKNKKFVEEFK